MKRALILLAILASFEMSAFDWKHQSNEELRGDMLEFAASMANQERGTADGSRAAALKWVEGPKPAEGELQVFKVYHRESYREYPVVILQDIGEKVVLKH